MVVTLQDITQLKNFSGASRTVIVTDPLRGGTFNWSDEELTDNDGTVFTATGVGEGFWVRDWNKQTVNVDWFGALADGTTNNTTAIVAASDTGASTVYFASTGTYLTRNILYNAGQHFIGKDKDTTIIKWMDGSIPNVNSDNLIARRVKGTSTVDATFEQLTFDANKTGVGRYSATSLFSDNITFLNCNFVNTSTRGISYSGNGLLRVIGCRFTGGEFLGTTSQTTHYIYLAKTIGFPGSTDSYVNAIIEGCYFEGDDPLEDGKGTGGIFVTADQGASCPVVIRNNEFKNIGAFNATNVYGPIYMYEHADNSIVENNRIIDRRYTGISVSNSHNVTVSNNYIDGVDITGLTAGVYPAAINVNQGTNSNTDTLTTIKIVGNTLVNNGDTLGISATGTDTVGELEGIWIAQNFIKDATGGIQVSKFRNLTIADNVVKNTGNGTVNCINILNGYANSVANIHGNLVETTTAAVGINATTTVTNTDFNLSGNTVKGATNIGINIRDFKNATLGLNNVSGGTTAYFIQNGTSALLSSNYGDVLAATSGVTTYREINNSWNIDVVTQVPLKANLASPALTGTPTAPTATLTATGTQIATLGYVRGNLDAYTISTATDWNTYTKNGNFLTPVSGNTNLPTGWTAGQRYAMFVSGNSLTSPYVSQLVVNPVTGEFASRGYNAGWSPWVIAASTSYSVSDGNISKTANYTIITTDYGKNGAVNVYVDATAGAVQIELEAAATMGSATATKTVNVIKTDASANAVTVKGNGSTNINGANTYVISSQYDNASIKSNGTQYYILS